MSRYNYNRNLKKWIIFATTTILLSILVVTTNNQNMNISFGENVISYITTPLSKIFYFSTSKVGEVVGAVFGTRQDHEKNIQLEIENRKLKEQVDKLSQVINNEEFLANEYDVLMKSSNVKLSAYVTAREPGNIFDGYNIDKGSQDGVSVGDIIVQGVREDDNVTKGLIGVITAVNTNNSKVQTLLDANVKISFRTTKSNEVGIINQSSSNILEGYMYNENPKIQVGDAIYTSGMGGVYPANIYIGEVVEVRKSGNNLQTHVKVKSPIDFNSLYRVLVIPKNSREEIHE